MHIIVVSDRLATAKTVSLDLRHGALAVVAFVVCVLAMSSLFSIVALRHLPEVQLPFVQKLLLSLRAEESSKTEEFLRENINTMAVKVGQLQAQLMRLDSLGERLSSLAGIKPGEFRASEMPGQGGMLITPTRSLSPAELQHQLDLLSKQVEARGDYLGLLESELLDDRVKRNLLPTTLPVATGWDSSSFGWRADPFTGEQAQHTGVDFTAEVGTPIVAAAGGVVIAAERHPQYGNMVDIDHGNDLVTRYAHASKLLVRPGMVVRRGQKIALVGSTGRSTGPHLHFEVRVNDVPRNPNRFLQAARANTLAQAKTR